MGTAWTLQHGKRSVTHRRALTKETYGCVVMPQANFAQRGVPPNRGIQGTSSLAFADLSIALDGAQARNLNMTFKDEQSQTRVLGT